MSETERFPRPPVGSRSGRRSLPTKIAIWGIGFSLFGFLTISTAYFWWVRSTNQALEFERKSVVDAGYPDSLDALNDWYPAIADEENGAIALQRVFEEFEKLDPDFERVKSLYEETEAYGFISEYPEELVEDLNAFVSDARPVLNAAMNASKYTQARFPIDLSQGLEVVDLTHLAKLRSVSRAMTLYGEHALLDGQVDLALKAYISVANLSNLLLDEPVLMSQLVRIQVQQGTLSLLEEVLSYGVVTAESLEGLDAAHARISNEDIFGRTIATERCSAVGAIQQIFEGVYDDSARTFDELVSLRDILPVHLGATYSKHEQLAMYKLYKGSPQGQEINWAAMADSKSNYDENFGLPSFMASLFVPVFDRTRIAFVRNEATIRIARTALAVEEFRLSHGVLPSSLEECVPSFLATVPLDPYTGLDLHYQAEGSGYTIYSVFDDLDDDGGTPWTREDGVTDGDLVFTVNRSTR